MPESNKENDKNNQLGKATSIGQTMIAVGDGILGAALLIVLGMYLGNFIDGKLMTTPWFAIVLSLTGGGLGLYRFVQKALSLGKD